MSPRRNHGNACVADRAFEPLHPPSTFYAQKPGVHFFGRGCGDKPSDNQLFLLVDARRQGAGHHEPHELELANRGFRVRNGGIWRTGELLHHPRPGQHMASLCVEQGEWEVYFFSRGKLRTVKAMRRCVLEF